MLERDERSWALLGGRCRVNGAGEEQFISSCVVSNQTRQPYRSIYNGYGLDTLEQGYAIEWRCCQRK